MQNTMMVKLLKLVSPKTVKMLKLLSPKTVKKGATTNVQNMQTDFELNVHTVFGFLKNA